MFTAGTLVLLASGKTVPISSLKTGDTVLASDTRTGKDQPETVTAVMVHHDTDLYDLTVKTVGGSEVIHTTAGHLFWDPYHHYWVAANKLSKGERLKTPNGVVAVADGGTIPKVHDGWMWDLTVPGNNDHDFYVLPAQTSDRQTYPVGRAVTLVLVHNCGNEVGTQVDYSDPNNDLVSAVRSQRLEDGRTVGGPGRGNYGAARLDDGSIITGRSGGGLHAEQDLINQANTSGRSITDLYTERAPCAARCQPLVGDMNVTWSFPWNGSNAAETAAIRSQSNADLYSAVQQLFGDG